MDKSIEFLLEMFPVDREIVIEVFEANDKNLDKTLSTLISMFSADKNHPPSYEEAVNTGANSLSANIEPEEFSNKKRRDSRRNLGKKEWKPPLLGKLSDDFLKVPNEISNNCATKGYLCKSCAKFSTVTSYQPSCDVQSASIAGAHSTFTYGANKSNLDDMDNLIRQRMEQNVNETKKLTMRSTNKGLEAVLGSDLESRSARHSMRVLEDERMALMLQNQEFLSIVKQDKEFLRALQLDQEENSPSVIEEREENDYDGDSDIWREPTSSLDYDSVSLSTFNPNDENYGYKRSDITDPDHLWPDHIGHSSVDENEVTKLYKAMGKASRKRLTALAKRFPSIRRKKSGKNYLDITNNGSSLNVPQPLTQSGSRMPRSSPIGRVGVPSSANWDTESTRELIYTEFDDLGSTSGSTTQIPPFHNTPSRRSTYRSPDHISTPLASRPRPKPKQTNQNLIDYSEYEEDSIMPTTEASSSSRTVPRPTGAADSSFFSETNDATSFKLI